jgi:hypothetical protein
MSDAPASQLAKKIRETADNPRPFSEGEFRTMLRWAADAIEQRDHWYEQMVLPVMNRSHVMARFSLLASSLAVAVAIGAVALPIAMHYMGWLK